MRLKFIKKEQKQQNTGAHDCEHNQQTKTTEKRKRRAA